MLNENLPYCGKNNIQELMNYMQEGLADCLTFDNEILPTSFHDDVRGYRTAEKLEAMCEAVEADSEYRRIKEIKARNVERLAAQVDALAIKSNGKIVELDGEIDYSQNEINDVQLTKNMLAMVDGMVNGGILNQEDLEG